MSNQSWSIESTKITPKLSNRALLISRKIDLSEKFLNFCTVFFKRFKLVFEEAKKVSYLGCGMKNWIRMVEWQKLNFSSS